MPEELDSTTEEGNPGEDSNSALATDLLGDYNASDSPSAASDSDSGLSEPSADPAPTTNNQPLDILRTPDDQLSPEGRAAKAFAKETQADYTRRMQDFKDERTRFDQERQQFLQTMQQQTANQTPQQQSRLEQLYAAAQDDDQRRGLDTVNEIMSEGLTPLRQQYQQLQDQYNQLSQLVLNMNQQQQQQQQVELNTEINAVRSKYGADAVQQHADALVGLYGRPNPATNQPYTLEEAFLLVSGQAQQQANQLAQQERQGRTSAQQQARTRGSAVVPDGEGELSQQEVLAGMRELGFE